MHIEQTVHVPIGILRDKHAADRRTLLEAVCHINGVTGGGKLARIAQRSHHHQTGMDADAHLQRQPRARVLDLAHTGLHCQCRPHCLLGVFFARLFGPKHRHNGIANVLLDRAAVSLQHAVQPVPN